jgi:hypothetical protein
MLISGREAMVLVLHDSVVEIVSIVCAAFLVWCLRLPMSGKDFSTVPYRLSCTVIPMIVSLHFHRKTNNTTNNADNNVDYVGGLALSCVSAAAASVLGNNDDSATDSSSVTLEDLRGDGGGGDISSTVVRHFPVILVFHTIVSISLWFMQYQNQGHQKSLEMVEKLKEDLMESKSKAKQGKKKR